MKKFFWAASFFLGGAVLCFSQTGNFEHLFTQPLKYNVCFTATAPVIDGDLKDTVWENAEWTENFQDIEGNLKPLPYYKTRAKMLWDKNYLYIAAELEEPDVWAYLTKHDEVVFFDNDFEVFIDPDNTTHRYFEYEINARNTIFDLFLPKPYRAGSGALISWDSNYLKHAVKVHGSLNDPTDRDQGWTVEMAIPFRDITIGNDPHVPKDGEIWRLNFSRVQWQTEVVDGKYVKKKDADGKNLPEHNWVWSPQGVINMHFPERWGYIRFTENKNAKKSTLFSLSYAESQKKDLWLVYYKQHEYKDRTGHFAKTLEELGVDQKPIIDNRKNELLMEANSTQFYVTITEQGSPISIHIDQEGYIFE